MKKWTLFLFAGMTATLLQGCLKDKMTMTYTIMTPVYKEKAAVLADIRSHAPRSLESPGKLFLYGQYIFLNERDKGVHIIDNSNPASPVMKGFISIPGNLDIAVKGSTLYADLYADLVVVDISNPLQANYVRHITDVFPERKYSNGFIADSNRVIVDWIRKDTTVRLNSPLKSTEAVFFNTGGLNTAASGGGIVGIAGSMARFSLVNNYLYTVNNMDLNTFDITQPQQPVWASTRQLGWNIETIYPFAGKLFIGSMNGMFIYDISNPAQPLAQGQFSHARSCDPVIADGNVAYVTLRDGTACDGSSNQLDVINISNVNAPYLLKTYELVNPHGLSKDGNLLFVCDGRDGLKMFDATDPLNLALRKRDPLIDTYDAIAWNGNLIVVAKEGLYQYAYAAPSTLNLKSKIAVNR